MRFINYLKTKVPALTIIGLTLGLTSCGSYQYVGQDSDGIYGTSKNDVEHKEEVAEVKEESSSNGYYQNYFKEKSTEMELASQEGEIFTDIDSYEGTYEEDTDNADVQSGYAGWGQQSDNVTINVYSNGFGYNSYWNSPYRWNRWGWNRPYYGGWNVGIGYAGYGWGNPFWCTPYYGINYGGYGYAYGNPYYNNYYGRNNYGRRGVAYNSGRRGTLLNRSSVLANRRTSTRTRSNVSTPRTRTRTKTKVRPRTRTRVRPNSSQSTIKSSKPRTRTSTPRTRTRTRATSTPRTNRSFTPRSNSSSRSSSSSRGGSSRRRG